MSVTRRRGPDLCASRARIVAGEVTASALVEASIAAADGPLARHAFIRRFDAQARAVAAGVKEVIFDRGGYTYHGRVAALADAAREGGLSF